MNISVYLKFNTDLNNEAQVKLLNDVQSSPMHVLLDYELSQLLMQLVSIDSLANAELNDAYVGYVLDDGCLKLEYHVKSDNITFEQDYLRILTIFKEHLNTNLRLFASTTPVFVDARMVRR